MMRFGLAISALFLVSACASMLGGTTHRASDNLPSPFIIVGETGAGAITFAE